MATTEERMMIMGLCLQGILANPNHSTPRTYFNPLEMGAGGSVAGAPEPYSRLATAAETAAQIEANVRLAHQYADRLMPPPPVSDAEQIKRLTPLVYEALRAAGELEGHDEPWGNGHADEEEVFEAVSQCYFGGDVLNTKAYRIVKAMVEVSRDPRQGDLFEGSGA